jgi:hypothetical protein
MPKPKAESNRFTPRDRTYLIFAFQATAAAPVRSRAATPMSAGIWARTGSQMTGMEILSAACAGQVIPSCPTCMEEYFFHLSRSFNGDIESHSVRGSVLRVSCMLRVKFSLVRSVRNDGADAVDDS